MPKDEFSLPSPLPSLHPPFVAVGRYGPSSVDAEDFSRRVGNWGGASHLIGDRWEALAPDLLRRRLPWQIPAGGGRFLVAEVVLALDADATAGRALQRAGVSAPDLLVVARLGGAGARPVVRAADCKVSLDTADIDQTAPARLKATFEKITLSYPQVAAALREQVAALPDAERDLAAGALDAALAGRWDSVLAGEGLFVAPDNGFNRWFLAQLERRRRTGAPLGRLPASGPRRAAADVAGPVDAARAARLNLPVHLEEIGAGAFLSDVAGWPEGELVAELDCVDLAGADLSVVERCWRVGAGLSGAVLALRRRLFAPAPDRYDAAGRPREVTAALRRVVARRTPPDSAGLIAAVAQTVDARRPLWEREAAALRAPVGFAAWTGRLPSVRGPSEGHRRSARARYAEMHRHHRQRIVTAAADLAGQGLEELQILEAIESRAAEWAALALADAESRPDRP